MHTGSDLLETWIPDGGFMIERRKLKTVDGGSALADCLVPRWADDELTRDLPCARQPCLHRIFAECPPSLERIASLASRYGLLTASIPRASAPGQVLRADALPPEPVEIWRKEIQELRAGPAQNCGIRLRTAAARSDKRFCSNGCKNWAFRRNQNSLLRA